jgi:hypothetical protein
MLRERGKVRGASTGFFLIFGLMKIDYTPASLLAR